MATSQNQGFIEQLREMRATRTQQLRQGGQQATLLSRQITAMTTLNKTMEAVLRAQTSSTATLKDINSKQSNISRQNEQMSKSINNLASSITRSMGSMASAVGRGTVGAVSSAGGSVVGAASSVASGVASSLARVLPFAIAGVVGKMALWDKMDDSVKKELKDSFGNLVESMFGSIDTSGITKVLEPITKELGIVFGALGDTFNALIKRFEKLPDSIEKVSEKMDEAAGKIKDTFDSLSKTFEKYEIKFKALQKTIGDLTPSVGVVATGAAAVGAKKIYDTAKRVPVAAANIPQAAAAAAAPATGATIAASKLFTASSPKMLSDKEMKIMQQTFDNMKKFGLKKDIFGLLGGRLITNIGGAFLQAVIKYKLTGIALVSFALKYVEYSYITNEIDLMTEYGYITNDEAKWLKGYIGTESFASAAGSVIVGTLGAVGGSVVGPVGTAVGGVSGAIAGAGAGADVGRATYELINPMPETLKSTDYQRLYEDRLPKTKGNEMRDREQGVSRGRRSNVKPQGAMSPSSASISTSAMDIVGSSEGGAAGYDAIYGFSGPGGDPSIPEKHGGKNISQLTIGEVIAIGKSRGGNRGALGKYQFMPTVLEGLLSIAGLTKNDIFSPENQDHLYRVFTQRNVQELINRGIEPTAENLHLAHAVGAGGANKLLKADPNAIAADVLGYEKGGDVRKTNPHLEKTTGEYIASITGKYKGGASGGSSSFAAADPGTATASTSYDENYARRKKEAKESEKYKEGSESFVGPTLAKSETSKPSVLGGFAKQFSVESFTSDFAQKTKELTDVVNSMFAAQTQQAPTVMADNSNVTNIINNSSGGSGGGPSINQVVSTHMSNMNWQFNSMSGGVRA
jgi:hypothetical protein